MKTINRLLVLLGRHDFVTLRHCRSVANLMNEWAIDMGLSDREARKAYICGLMHDISKLQISSQMINKPEQLTDCEWIIIKKHPEYGWKILDFARYDEISHIIKYHHERYDGTGGEGLRGVQIPLLSRMIAICNAFDEMTGKRCYTEGMRTKQALAEITNCAESQFDPFLCQLFVRFALQSKKSTVGLITIPKHISGGVLV